MKPRAIESLERATVAAVAPPEMIELEGWLLPFDAGTIGRAKSATPLRHDAAPGAIEAIVAAYGARGLKPAFRIADVAGLKAVQVELTRRGFAAEQPTIFKTGSIEALAGLTDGAARCLEAPDAAWKAVFLGEGFDRSDAQHRVAALSRSPGAIFAAAGDRGETHAVGVMSFGEGWAGIHGMRTSPSHPGQGLASRVLATLGKAAQARSVDRVFLQVEEGNPARSIYRRAGLKPAWRYHYWR